MKPKTFGRAIFWDGGSLWIGLTGVRSDWHAHHAIQLGLALTGTVQFKMKADPDWVHYAGVLIPPNLPHTFQAPGELVANMFCEPESAVGRQIVSRFNTAALTPVEPGLAQSLGAELKSAFGADASDAQLIAIAKRCFTALADGAGFASPADFRVQKAIREIHRRLEDPLTLGEIAAVVGLSEGRFRHLFVGETGMPFRAYLLWARLNRALQLGFSGSTWTEAAHAANFADAAHLTRTCHRMFGFAPSSAQRGQTEHRGQLSA